MSANTTSFSGRLKGHLCHDRGLRLDAKVAFFVSNSKKRGEGEYFTLDKDVEHKEVINTPGALCTVASCGMPYDSVDDLERSFPRLQKSFQEGFQAQLAARQDLAPLLGQERNQGVSQDDPLVSERGSKQ